MFEVINIVSKFDQKTSYGVDGIPIYILRTTVGSIAEPLSRLINCSLSTGFFPPKLKICKMIPVFKDGDKHSFSNYRPISVLPSFYKFTKRLLLIDFVHILTLTIFYLELSTASGEIILHIWLFWICMIVLVHQ